MAALKKQGSSKKKRATTENPKAEDPVVRGPVVVVYCKLPSGTSFTMLDGRVIKLNGANHKDGTGRSLIISGYGRTEIAEADWEYISETYGGLKVFDANNPVVFAAESEKDGDAIAREYGPSVTTGLEQRHPREIIKHAEREAGNVQKD